MHYYIYPNGGNAKYLVWAIDFLNAHTSAGWGGLSMFIVIDSLISNIYKQSTLR